MSDGKSRILDILKMLLDGITVDVKDIADRFDITTRSAQRDIKTIKEYFGDGLDNSKRGEYKLIRDAELKGFLEAKKELGELKDLFELLVMIDSPLLNHFSAKDYPLLESIKREVNEIFYLCEPPIEEYFDTKNILRDLKKAIKNRQYINLIYNEPKVEKYNEVQPHKILFSKGNLYVAIKISNDDFNGGIRLLRVAFVDKVELLSHTYHRDIEIENFIKNTQTLFTSYGAKKYEVKVIVSPKIARHFRGKKHLRSQKILSEDEYGLLLSFEINNSMEIIPLVKTWLPELKIISPKKLKDEIDALIREYLN